jgi:hypothetical protein
MVRRKQEIITLKVDSSLLEAMRGVRNRSDFVRGAILAALDGACPLCMGTGVLTPRQKEHWEAFAKTHPIRECPDCHELQMTCGRGGRAARPAPTHRRRARVAKERAV